MENEDTSPYCWVQWLKDVETPMVNENTLNGTDPKQIDVEMEYSKSQKRTKIPMEDEE